MASPHTHDVGIDHLMRALVYTLERTLDNATRQLAGVENLAGTYPFDFARSRKAFRLNEFLHRMVEPAHRARFLADPEGAFEDAGLT